MQEKISKLQGEVSANEDNTAQRIVERLKADHGYTFQKKDMNNNSNFMQTLVSISRKHKMKQIRLNHCQQQRRKH